jgi:hypothetical protein
MVNELENELTALTDRLRFGGTQQQCAELRARIEAVRAKQSRIASETLRQPSSARSENYVAGSWYAGSTMTRTRWRVLRPTMPSSWR